MVPMAKTVARKSKHFPSENFFLLAILTLALILRIWGVSFGLPETFHADEPIVVNHALAYGTGDWNPHFFKIRPLVSYLLFAVYGIYYLIFRGLGKFQGVEDFQNLFLNNPTSFYLLARLIFGAFLGTATVYLFYRLCRKYFSKEQALISSFFLAVSFLHVRDSHFIYVDIPLLFVLVACFFPILQLLDKAGRKVYLLFGVLLGTAVAVKYNGVFVFVPFLTAYLLRKRSAESPLLDTLFLKVGLISMAAFALLNPFSWLDWKFFLGELSRQSQAEGATHFLHHLTYSLNGGLGFPLLVFSIFGILRNFWIRDKKRWVLISFIGTYYLVLCFFSQPYDRYVLPLLPFLCFFAADFLIWGVKQLPFSFAFLGILALAVAFPSLVKVIRSDQIFSREDIRSLVRDRVETVIPSGAKIVLDVPLFMPRLKWSLAQLEEKKRELETVGNTSRTQIKRLEAMMRMGQNESGPRYELYFLSRQENKNAFLFSRPAIPYDLDSLKKKGIQYVLVAKIKPDFEPKFYEDLKKEGIFLAKFSPYQDQSREWPIDSLPLTGGPFLWSELSARERNGHILEIYRLKE